jgi:hypothetical protein
MRALLALVLLAISCESLADSRADTSLEAVAQSADWIALGVISKVSEVDCDASFGPVIVFTLRVSETWKGSVGDYMEFRVLKRPWTENIRRGGHQDFKTGQQVVVAFEPMALPCVGVTQVTGLLPLDSLGVDTSTLANESSSQSLARLRARVDSAIRGRTGQSAP